MSKSTGAVILPSAARLSPWGDDGWRFAGAIQVVEDGPDFLHAEWPVLDGEEGRPVSRFASLVLRDHAVERAADIAVMVIALLQLEDWRSLERWWHGTEVREELHQELRDITAQHAGTFKLAIVETRAGAIAADLIEELSRLGFESTIFAAVSWPRMTDLV